ncbi:hypothetical protein J6590_071403 [Homalodisca vitripennis]|nr:hypothetical protein J6590_071403 [Homalodisca vitripennis]
MAPKLFKRHGGVGEILNLSKNTESNNTECTLQTVPELVDISLPASRQTIDVSIVLAELHQHVILGAIKVCIA